MTKLKKEEAKKKKIWKRHEIWSTLTLNPSTDCRYSRRSGERESS